MVPTFKKDQKIEELLFLIARNQGIPEYIQHLLACAIAYEKVMK